MKKQQGRKSALFRIHQIDEEIRRGGYPSASALAGKLEVSLRTIERDLDTLRDYYHAPLEYDTRERGWHYTEPNFFVKYVSLGEGELFSLALLDQLLLQYRNTPLEARLKTIFAKIKNSLPESVTVDSRFLSNDITYIPDALARIDEGVFDAVFSALKNRRVLRFDYEPLQKATFMERALDPYHIVCQRGNWYVIGRCHLKNGPRIFSFSRMKNAVCTEEPFAASETFSAEKYIDRTMGVWLSAQKPFRVRLLFSAEIGTFAAERVWHEKQTVKKREDGSVEVGFTTTQLPEVLRWVLGQGGTVEVLEPPELAERVQSEAKKVLALYQKKRDA